MLHMIITLIKVLYFMLQVEGIVPGSLPLSIKGPVILIVHKAGGDEEVKNIVLSSGQCFVLSFMDLKPMMLQDVGLQLRKYNGNRLRLPEITLWGLYFYKSYHIFHILVLGPDKSVIFCLFYEFYLPLQFHFREMIFRSVISQLSFCRRR